MYIRLVFAIFVCLASGALAADRVDSRLVGERAILVVPMVGAGTFEDPQRPLGVPLPGEASRVQAFSWVPSDDGRLAIVMLVIQDPTASAGLLSDKRIVKAFRKGADRRDDVEREIRKIKRDFALEQLLGGVR